MKLRIIYTFFVLLFGSFLLISSSGGRATVTNEGNTGAPNDNANNNRVCQSCHNNGSYTVTPEIEITDASGTIISTDYIPGETYNVKMTVNSTGMPAGFGFQIVALNAASGVDAAPVNTWSIPASTTNATIATIGNGRQYAEHNGISSSNEFIVEWVAPAGGDVTFYYGGNAVNDSGNTNGDNAIAGEMSISADPTSTNDLEKAVTLDIFPNPVNDVINLKSTTEVTETYDLFLYDQTGRQISLQKVNINSGQQVTPINVEHLPTGIYGLVLSDGKNLITKKVVKL